MLFGVAEDHDSNPIKFLYMADMAWNSSMNARGVMEMLEAKRDDGSSVIPR